MHDTSAIYNISSGTTSHFDRTVQLSVTDEDIEKIKELLRFLMWNQTSQEPEN